MVVGRRCDEFEEAADASTVSSSDDELSALDNTRKPGGEEEGT
jgi:hypothetical protein